ncbi:unnamed protein product [Blepharisma stoltei]|uniref:Cyclic nucleotide-binding domain-containing protein n=1 Tax=Blepharisma stoltei TaxID=1481888 RepID=A0AAU9J1Y0_9CILI|nr:unnamed protein product [Blepharisma stoltei]
MQYSVIGDRKSALLHLLHIPPQERSYQDLCDLSNLISDIKIFQDFKYTLKLKNLCKHLLLVSYGTKETIFREGDDGEAFYYIISGKVIHYVSSSKNGKTKLISVAESKEGDSFGELGLLYGIKRSSSAITNTPVEAMVLTKENYDKETKGDDLEIQTKAIHFFQKHKLLQSIPQQLLIDIAKKCKKPIEFKTSDLIVKQGFKSDAIFFIIKGAVKLMRRIDFKKIPNLYSILSPSQPNDADYQEQNIETKLVEIQNLSKGDSIADYEVLRNLPCSCTAIATMPTKVYKVSMQDLKLLDSTDFQNLVNFTESLPDDNEIRKIYIHTEKWNSYKHSYVNSIKFEKKYKNNFNFRMEPIKSFKSRSITPENIFSKPLSHIKLSPIYKTMF